MSQRKVFDDPSSFHNFAEKKGNCKWSLSNAQLCNCDLRRNVTEVSTLGGLLKSIETQKAKPRFMFDGKEMIGGNFWEAET